MITERERENKNEAQEEEMKIRIKEDIDCAEVKVSEISLLVY